MFLFPARLNTAVSRGVPATAVELLFFCRGRRRQLRTTYRIHVEEVRSASPARFVPQTRVTTEVPMTAMPEVKH